MAAILRDDVGSQQISWRRLEADANARRDECHRHRDDRKRACSIYRQRRGHILNAEEVTAFFKNQYSQQGLLCEIYILL